MIKTIKTINFFSIITLYFLLNITNIMPGQNALVTITYDQKEIAEWQRNNKLQPITSQNVAIIGDKYELKSDDYTKLSQLLKTTTLFVAEITKNGFTSFYIGNEYKQNNVNFQDGGEKQFKGRSKEKQSNMGLEDWQRNQNNSSTFEKCKNIFMSPYLKFGGGVFSIIVILIMLKKYIL